MEEIDSYKIPKDAAFNSTFTNEEGIILGNPLILPIYSNKLISAEEENKIPLKLNTIELKNIINLKNQVSHLDSPESQNY